jgi:hypothetical protein
MSEAKFKKGDFIVWDGIIWLVVNVDNETYDLKLANQKQFNTKHGNGGYMDIQTIDKTATLFEMSLKSGGSKRSRKTRGYKTGHRRSKKRN